MDLIPSAEELAVLRDDHFLVVKQGISEKIIAYLAEIERKLHKEIMKIDFPFPDQAFLRTGKISKGENYQSLPFFILDYPRMFSKTDVFAFRSMLWWGKEYSCTFHLAGDPLQRVKNVISERLKKEQDLYFCVHTNPWEYHFEPDNYLPIGDVDQKTIEMHIESNNFIKISSKIPVDDWNQYPIFTLNTLNRFLSIIH